MYPNQNQYPIDYLNEIAPETKPPRSSNKLLVIVAIVGGVLALIVGAMMLLGGGSTSTQKLETLTARLQTLQDISSKSQKNIKSGTLRSTNSNLSIFLTNANRDITTPLEKSGVNPKKLDKKIVASESGDDLTAKLEDARLNAVFDRTYAREMSYQLATVAGLMKELYNSTKSKSLKDFLLATDKNLQPIKQQLTDFNAATS